MKKFEPSMLRARRFLVLFLSMVTCVGGILSAARGEEPLRVIGHDAKTKTWTAAQLQSDFASEIKPVEYSVRGQKHTSKCIALVAVLKAARVPTDLKMDPKADPKLKNYNLRLVVVVQGADGYTTAFSLGELLPDMGKRDAWLALDEDGKPLPERDGHVKLIVPGDDKPARWVRDVAVVTVVDPLPPTTAPAK